MFQVIGNTYVIDCELAHSPDLVLQCVLFCLSIKKIKLVPHSLKSSYFWFFVSGTEVGRDQAVWRYEV